MATIAIIGALEDETAGLLAELKRSSRFKADGSAAWQGGLAGKDVVLVRSGPERQRSLAASDFVLKHYKPLSALLSIGFCGAVRDDLRAGDLVLCATVYAQDESESYRSDPLLVRRACEALRGRSIPYCQGSSLTALRVVGDPEAKADIGRRLPVAVVEMEGYWLAQRAANAAVPFLALRAVLDEVSDWVPDEDFVDEAGIVQRHRAMAYLLRHPERTKDLMRLGANLGKASASLTSGVLAILERWAS